MKYFFAKFLPMLVMPLWLSLMLLLIGGILLWKNKKSWSLLSLTLAVFVLYFNAIPATGYVVSRFWQGKPFFVEIDSVRARPAVVVLGGFMERIEEYPDHYFFGAGIDRLLSGIELYKKRKGAYLILSGGTYPGETVAPEAETMFHFSTRFAGLSADSILMESKSANTEENAQYTRVLLDSVGLERDIILVTSASHMRRAAMLFRKEGFSVYEYPTDFSRFSNREMQFPLVIMPSSGILDMNSRLYREMLGYWWHQF